LQNDICLRVATGDFCYVASLSPAAEYEVRKMHFNRRLFLEDFWRELSAVERNWLAQQNSLIEWREGVTYEDENAR